MPDRIIRDELLDSEKWISLSDDTVRLAYVAVLLRCDALGNYPADLFRLRRLWRDLQIPSEETAAKRLAELVDHDLLRLYDADGKRYLHVPRFRQRIRYIRRLYPLSPWTTNEEKQRIVGNSPGEGQAITGSAPAMHRERTAEVKRSEVKRSEAFPAAAPELSTKQSTGSPHEPAQTWADFWTAKGKALGIEAQPGEKTGAYCRRVMEHVKGKDPEPSSRS